MDLSHLQRIDTSRSERIEVLETLPWSWDLSFDLLSDLASYLSAYQLVEGQVLFSEGDRGAFMVFLIGGRIEIRKDSSPVGEVLVVRFQEGKVFGEMPLLDGGPRSASAVAMADSKVYLLTQEAFFRMKKEHPRLAMMIVLKLARILSQRLRRTTGKWAELLA